MLKILIVDDSRVMRTHIKNSLSGKLIERCFFIEADNGNDALRMIQTRGVDLVLLDWNMPKMSGIDFLKQVRAIPEFKHTPIIMVTSFIKKKHVMEALEHGVSDYVVKPVNELILKEKIHRLLDISHEDH